MVITVLMNFELFRLLSEEERNRTRPYLIASVILYFGGLAVFNGTTSAEQSELLANIGLIAYFVALGLIFLFVYYFQTRLNTIKEFKNVGLFELLIAAWFLQSYRKILPTILAERTGNNQDLHGNETKAT